MDEAREWRRRTQPLAEPNCGSVFKNPPDGHAARLIEEAGLKGMRSVGLHVSTKHANFIVAAEARAPTTSPSDRPRPGACRAVRVRLEPEVQMLEGEPDRATR